MFDRVRKFFENHIQGVGQEPGVRGWSRDLRVATAALLVEISRADSRVTAAEREAVVAAVQRVFELGPDETAELVKLAEEEVEHATSLYPFTRLVDAEFSAQQKKQIVELLWGVSFADGELDKYEEYLVRKIADLLHVSHADFIHAKYKAMDGRR